MPAIPLNNKPFYSSDPIANDVASEGMWDCAMDQMPDGKMVTRKRPGLAVYADVGGLGGQGIYYCDRLNTVFFVTNGTLYKMTQGSGLVSTLGGTFNAGAQIEFAEGQDLDSTPVIYMADGTNLKYTKGTNVVNINPGTKTVTFTAASPTVVLCAAHGYAVNDAVQFSTNGTLPTGLALIAGTTTSIVYYVSSVNYTANSFQITTAVTGGTMVNTSDIGTGTHSVSNGDYNAAPTRATSVVWFNNRFIANDADTGFFYATGINTNTGSNKFGEFDNYFWNSVFNPFIAEAKGDNIGRLISVNQELYAWGGEGLETWQDDGVSPLSNVPQAFKEVGLIAPDSVVTINGTTLAVVSYAGRRDIIAMIQRQVTPIGADISKILNEYTTVDDAIGMYVTAQGMEFYVVTFPTEGTTWAYDTKHQYWAKWGAWDLAQATYNKFRGIRCCYAKQWGKTLLQSTADGKVYEVSREFFSDAGNIIRAARRTGWIDWDTYFRRKRSDQLFLKMKTGQQDGTPTLLMRWRSDGRPEWSNYMELPMFPSGQQDFLAKLNRFGIYRARQYEFVLSDAADLALCEFQEEYTLLRS